MLTKDSPIAEIEAETERLKKLLSDNGYKVSECVPTTLVVDSGYIVLGFRPEISFELQSPTGGDYESA